MTMDKDPYDMPRLPAPSISDGVAVTTYWENLVNTR